MNSFAVGKVPACSGGVVTLENHVAVNQVLVFHVLDQDILKRQLLSGALVNVGPVGTAGKMLGAVVQAVLFIVLKITSGRKLTPRHVDVCSIFCGGVILGQGVGNGLAGKEKMSVVGKAPIAEGIAFLPNHIGESLSGGISVVRSLAI